MNLAAHWAQVNAILSRALDGERDRLRPADAAVIQDYLDHNELALAHDHLIDALGDVLLAPLPSTAALLGEAAGLMGHRR